MHPEVLRILILTADAPHKALGVPRSATIDEIQNAAGMMRRAVQECPRSIELLIDTINRAEVAMTRQATTRPKGGVRNHLNTGPMFAKHAT